MKRGRVAGDLSAGNLHPIAPIDYDSQGAIQGTN